MPIQFAPEGINGCSLLRNRLLARRRVSRSFHEGIAAFMDVSGDSLNLKTPHAQYDLLIADVLRGEGLNAAQFIGIRHLIEVSGQVVGAGQVLLDRSGKPHKVGKLSFGPFSQQTAISFGQLATLLANEAKAYEARFLTIRAIALFAIWLKGEESGDDIIYPIGNGWGRLQVNSVYTEEELFAAILPHAHTVIELHRKWKEMNFKMFKPDRVRPKMRTSGAGPDPV